MGTIALKGGKVHSHRFCSFGLVGSNGRSLNVVSNFDTGRTVFETKHRDCLLGLTEPAGSACFIWMTYVLIISLIIKANFAQANHNKNLDGHFATKMHKIGLQCS